MTILRAQSIEEFAKRSSLIEYDRRALAEDAAALDSMARAEGLDAHARSVELRRADDAAD